MTGSWFEILISIVILVGLAGIIFRQGVRNPVPTADLATAISGLKTRLVRLEGKIDRAASVEEFRHLSAELVALEKRSASSEDVTALSGKVARLEERLEGSTRALEVKIDMVAAAADRTEQAVVRIEQFLMSAGGRR